MSGKPNVAGRDREWNGTEHLDNGYGNQFEIIPGHSLLLAHHHRPGGQPSGGRGGVANLVDKESLPAVLNGPNPDAERRRMEGGRKRQPAWPVPLAHVKTPSNV